MKIEINFIKKTNTQKMTQKWMNLFLKTIKFLSLLIFALFIIACAFYCFSDGFFIFMIPFLFSLVLFLWLNKKLKSQFFLTQIFTEIFVYLIIYIIIIICWAAFYFLTGYFDFSLFDLIFDTIYCDGLDDTDSGSNQKTNLDSPGNNTNNTSPDTNSKIELDSEKYYHMRKDSVDKAVELVSKGLETGIEKAVANMGAATAAGTAATAVLKSSLPAVPKLALAGASAAVVGASTKIGIAIGEAVLKGKENHTTDALNKMDPDKIPSPTDYFVPSLLDTPELVSPLEELIRYQFILNFLIFFSIVILIALLFNKMFLSNNLFVSFITRFFNKDIVLKFNTYRIKIDYFNNNFFFLLFGINSITLLFNIFLSIVISWELSFNLDYYILTHNGIIDNFCALTALYGG